MSAALILIGVVHFDPAGHWRLAAGLDRLDLAPQKTLVSVEASPLSLAFRRRHAAELISQLNESLAALSREWARPMEELWAQASVVGLARFVWPPFEFTAARAWVGPGRVRLAEPAATSLEELSRAWELFSVVNLRILLAQEKPSLEVLTRRAYAEAAASLGRGGSGGEPGREDRLARFIQGLLAPGRTVVHVGGWTHLPGLSARLSRHHPASHLLDALADGAGRVAAGRPGD